MSAGLRSRRRWQAPEVVQTSAMDCGPAALKCLLEGHGIEVNYARLREACQTSLDGTSIDTLEQVATQLGMQAEQVLIPADHLALPAADALPAIAVVAQADGATHFVVVWRRCGPWLQVMDPASGRRWVRADRFAAELLRHRSSVPATGWREWAGSADNTAPLHARLCALGADAVVAQSLIDAAQADAGWFAFGALDAAVRLTHAVVQGGGVARGASALRLTQALFDATRNADDDIFAQLPQAWWSALPDVQAHDQASAQQRAEAEQHLVARGAVLLRVRAKPRQRTQPQPQLQAQSEAATLETAPAALPPALQAALRERQPHPMRSVARLLREDGLLGPLALCGAMALAAGALVAETLLFRGVFDISAQLGLPGQRLLALAALLGFAALLLVIEVPIVRESLRYGRHLETRLRLALLAKLPQLDDRYFQSRSVSDMAERSHAIQLARQVPTLGLNFVQSLAELLLTLIGVAWIAPDATPWALALVAAAALIPAALQPLHNERDLRLRNHAAALGGFYLDALLGLVPIRTHRAERAVQRQHESLLVEWARSARALAAAALAAASLQALLCQSLAAALLVTHFLRTNSVAGSDLLLVYWALKLPALAGAVGGLARQYPQQRNMLMRLFEPLTAPQAQAPQAAPRPFEPTSPTSAPTIAASLSGSTQAVDIRIERGRVLAGGHEILREVDLHIGAGEHVAIVGASGAGKSSLLGLLLGWHALADGHALVDGRALDTAAHEALRRVTAWVDPGVQLWNRSFLDNLLYASDDGALSRVGAVVQAARLSGVLARLPQGLQTPLGEGGSLLSGGEGQRVRLARAMLQSGVRLALLDEPFRGLDREQRRGLLADARRWWRDSSLLCVTHDVGETLDFTRVLVVDDGRIVEDGAPRALAARADSRYARMLRDEQAVLRSLWRGRDTVQPAQPGADGWRHIRVEAGVVRELGLQSAQPMPQAAARA